MIGTAILWTSFALAQDAAAPTGPIDVSAAWQERIERRYREFEQTLERMASILEKTDPDRAALLKRAFADSRQKLIAAQLRDIIDQVDTGQLKEALEKQEIVLADMQALLELLLSEDRAEELRRRREALEAALKEIQRLAGEQRRLRAQAQNADGTSDSTKLAENQRALADQTQAANAKESAPAAKDLAAPSPASPGSSASAEAPGSAERSKNLASAEKSMRDAADKLQQSDNASAARDQDQAIQELEKASQNIEQTLKQQREEERQEMLADLQSRLEKVLDAQRTVREQTVRIDQIPTAERTRADQQKAVQLSRDESAIVAGLDQVLALLVEDGTAIAFPETVEQLIRDAESVVALLAASDASSVTQAIQSDIIATLEEMLAAVEKARSQDAPKPGGGSPGSGPGKSPLVEKLAELKMIRSLQARINERTRLLNHPSPQADESLRDLADRQHRVYQITRDIAEGASP